MIPPDSAPAAGARDPSLQPSPWGCGLLTAAALVFPAFLAVNLATAERSPVIWQDEVMFADPAVNLYFGHGFTTSAWYQHRDTFFGGNSPLYSMTLYPWIRVF